MKTKNVKLLTAVTLAITLLTGTATATDLQNIESITPLGSENINVNGTLDLNGNNPIIAPTNVDGVDLDNPAWGLYVNGNQYEIDTGDTDSRYLNRQSLDTLEANIDMNGYSINNVNSLSTEQVNNIVPFSARGTGLNNNDNRYVRIGGNEVVNSGSRGLTLVVVSKSDYSIKSTQNYDTYGSSTASNNLASALNNMDNSEIGILTSYDAWENSVTSQLDSALKNVGLFKGAATVNSGSRRPYAAIFSGTGDSGGSRAQEILLDDSSDQPHAQLRGFLMDGSFISKSTKQNNLIANQGNSVGVRVLNSGRVEIPNGDTSLQNNNLDDVSSIYSDDSSTNFFGGCSSGQYVESINADGSVNCASDSTGGDGSTTNELQDLQTDGNQLSLTDSGVSVTAPYSNNADQLDGVQLGNINWGDTAMSQNDVSASNVGLGNVRNVDLNNAAGSSLSYDTGNEQFNINEGSILSSGNDLDSNGDVSGLTDVTTDDLSEGDSNLYYTTSRARGDIRASDVGLGNVENIAQSSLAGDQLSWDSNNNEIDLSGSLYGDEDAQDAVGNIMTGNGATTVSYDDGNNQITISSSNTQLDDVQPTSNVNMNSQGITNLGSFEFPVGADAY